MQRTAFCPGLPFDEVERRTENSSSTVSMRFLLRGRCRRSSACPTCRNAVLARRVDDRRRAAQDAPRPETHLELGVFWIVWMFRLVLGIQVIEVAEELVEAMDRWQKLIPVAEMILAELSCDVALRLEQLRERGVLSDSPSFAPGKPTFSRPVRTDSGR